ncbi:hypothetical protein ACJX0J_040375, partial [Zea mays]
RSRCSSIWKALVAFCLWAHRTLRDDRGSQQQRPQYSSQASGQQQNSFRPSAPRGRGARGFGG